MSWHNLDFNISTLEAETVNNVFENIEFLRNAAIEKGISVETLTVLLAETDTIIAEIGAVLQNIENNITKINNVTESAYYREHKEIGKWFRLPDYQRWVLILSDLYDIIINEKGKWQILSLNDGIPTISNKKIIIRGEVLGD